MYLHGDVFGMKKEDTPMIAASSSSGVKETFAWLKALGAFSTTFTPTTPRGDNDSPRHYYDYPYRRRRRTSKGSSDDRRRGQQSSSAASYLSRGQKQEEQGPHNDDSGGGGGVSSPTTVTSRSLHSGSVRSSFSSSTSDSRFHPLDPFLDTFFASLYDSSSFSKSSSIAVLPSNDLLPVVDDMPVKRKQRMPLGVRWQLALSKSVDFIAGVSTMDNGIVTDDEEDEDNDDDDQVSLLLSGDDSKEMQPTSSSANATPESISVPAPAVNISWKKNDLVLDGRKQLQGVVWRRGEVRTGVTSIQGAPGRLYTQAYELGTAEAFGGTFAQQQARLRHQAEAIERQQIEIIEKHREALKEHHSFLKRQREIDAVTGEGQSHNHTNEQCHPKDNTDHNAKDNNNRTTDNNNNNNNNNNNGSSSDDEDDARIEMLINEQLAALYHQQQHQHILYKLQSICQEALDGWRKMWCVVKDQRLYFYHDREDRIPSDCVSLHSLDGLRVSQLLLDEKDETNTMFIILYGDHETDEPVVGVDVDAKCLEVHLRVGTAEDRAVWMDTLSRIIRRVDEVTPTRAVIAAERRRYCESITSQLTIFDPIFIQPHHPDRPRLRRKLLALDFVEDDEDYDDDDIDVSSSTSAAAENLSSSSSSRRRHQPERRRRSSASLHKRHC